MIDNIEAVPITFDEKFLSDYARRLVDDPEVAIVELISNCSDAGATLVEIKWPTEQYQEFSIWDNGTGMSSEEFIKIWNTLSYNRRKYGSEIVFPTGVEPSNRKLYGKNGKGRFSLFCFNSEYKVETCKDRERSVFKVCHQAERRQVPIQIKRIKEDGELSSHGTKITCDALYKYIKINRLVELIGCKFLADPSLRISVNGELIELTSLDSVDPETVMTSLGEIEIYTLDSGRGGRTSHPHGVAWHINGKGVGNVGWRDPNRMYTLDARTSEAKRYTFIVVADILADFVNSDWSGFADCDKTDEVLGKISKHIQGKLDDLFYEKRQERKQAAMSENEKDLKRLSDSSNKRIEQYVDEIQKEVRTIDQNTLNAMVKLLTNLEAASTRYDLLYRLAKVPPNDLDRLNEILQKWSIRDAEIVLDELDRRLKLIEKLEELVDQNVDELHVIHPLIEQGLWIFGPEYEGVSYTSNKGLRKVFKELLGDRKTFIDQPRLRPDIVAVAEVFSRDSYGDDGEVNGLEKVLIIELKRGGSEVSESEMQDVVKYARKISKSGNLVPTGKIVGFLLGSTLGDDTEPLGIGDSNRIRIEARTYQTVIRQAKARTFHLLQKIKQATEETRQEPRLSR